MIAAVSAGGALGSALPAAAGEREPAAARAPLMAAVQVSQASETRSFSIPAQPLPSALELFADQAGVSFAYKTGDLSGLRSPGVTGSLAPADALQRLLAGTGVSWRFTDDRTVVLEMAESGDAMTIGPITVEGASPPPPQAEIGNLPPAYAGGQVARGGKLGLLGNRDMMDTPFNQTSYTAEVIKNQQARRLNDVVLNDPSVRASWPSTGYTDPLVIRGFLASNQDVGFNGLYGVAPTFAVGVGMAERVEVLKGPNALLAGMQPSGSVGGGVNIVPKRAQSEPIYSVTGSYVSETQFGGHVDVGRRFGADQQFGVRFNGSLEDGGTEVDDQSRTFGSAVAGLDFVGEDLRVALDLGYQLQEVQAPTLITFVSAGIEVPDVPDTSSNWFFPCSWVETQDKFGALRAEYDLAQDWTVYAAAGAKETDWERLTYFPTITNTAGDLTGTPGHLNFRYVIDTEEVGLRGRLETGPVDHQLSLSGSRFHQDTFGLSVAAGGPLASNLYNPSAAPEPAIGDLDRPLVSENLLTSVALADVLSVFDERLQLILGLRRQKVDTRNFSNTTGDVTSEYEKVAFTPAVGLVVKPWSNVSLYGNYIEGLQQGTIVGGTFANAGETLAPFVSEQYEAGIKVDWGEIATTLSAFQITQPSGSSPSATGVFTADGEQRNRGLELNVFGQVSEGVRVLGGVSLMDAALTQTANGANDGNDAPGVPEIQVNFGAEWDLPFLEGLTLTGRVIYTGEQQVDNANTQSIPDWTRFDIGARYSFEVGNRPITIRAGVENLFDNDYWASSAYAPGWLSPGAPRTFLVSTTVDF